MAENPAFRFASRVLRSEFAPVDDRILFEWLRAKKAARWLHSRGESFEQLNEAIKSVNQMLAEEGIKVFSEWDESLSKMALELTPRDIVECYYSTITGRDIAAPKKLVNHFLCELGASRQKSVFFPQCEKMLNNAVPFMLDHPEVQCYFAVSDGQPLMRAFVQEVLTEVENGHYVDSPSDPQIQEASLVLLSPSFGRLPADAKESRVARTYQASEIVKTMEFIEEGVRVAAFVPEGTLFSTAEVLFRDWLRENHTVEAIYSLPQSSWFSRGLKTSCLVLRKGRPERNSPVRLVNLTIRGVKTRPRSSDDKEILGQEKTVEARDFLSGANWSVQAELGKQAPELQAYLSSAVRKVALSEIAESIFRGMPISNRDESEEGSHRLVNIRDLDDLSDPGRFTRVQVPDKRRARQFEIQPGDVLLACRGTSFKAALVNDVPEPTVISGNIIAIRLTDRYNPAFLQTFLNSPVGFALLETNQSGTVVNIVTPHAVGAIQVPFLPIEKQKEIANRRKQIEERYQEAVATAENARAEQLKEVFSEMGCGDH